MSRRISSLNNTAIAIERNISSQYDNVKIVAENIDDVVIVANSISGVDLSALRNAPAILADIIQNKTDAETAVTMAEAAKTMAETAYDSFDDRYLGVFASNPSTDNDGQALLSGALYFNSTVNSLRVYDGTGWSTPFEDAAQAVETATTAQIAAETSQGLAETAETRATNSAIEAEHWANYATDSAVPEGSGEFSSKHYAEKARGSAITAASDAATASTAALDASASETNASMYAAAALTSETNASTSETNAATSEAKAQSWAAELEDVEVEAGLYSSLHHAAKAAASASAAAASESNAAASEINANTSALAAANSETNAATSETNAATYASNAFTSETNASTSAINAATSESNAFDSATAALAAEAGAVANYSAFDDRYLGAKTIAPTLDNNGNPLLTGALYWHTTLEQLYVWDGNAWNQAAFSIEGSLSDLADDATHRLVTDAEKDVWNSKQDALVADTDYLTPTTAAATYAPILGATDNYLSDIEQAKLAGIEEGATADQTKEDIDALGIDAATVNGKTVETSVPVGAVFTDTVYDDTDVVKAPGGVLPALDGSNLTNVSTVASINDLTDVDTTTVAPSIDNALVWNGTNWVPGSVASDIAVIVQPAITSPIDGAAGVLLAPTIQFSPYYSLYGKPQQALQVQIATDDLFTTPIVDETLGAVSEYTTSNLDTTTQYYSRGRYQNDDGVWSEWSPVVSFTTADIYTATPNITSPVDNALYQSLMPSISASAFNTINGIDSHESTDWQVASTSNFSSIVWQSSADISNLTSVTVPGGTLAAGETYYLRVRYTGTDFGTSAWSPVITITTDEVAQPSITSPLEDAVGVALNATLSASVFSVGSTDNHLSSDWEVATDSLFANVVFSSYADTSNLTSINVSGLSITTQYYARVRYTGQSFGSSEWSAPISFTTADIYIEQPTITSPTSGATDIGETPTFTTDAFNCINGTDTHASSSWYLYRTSDEVLVWSSVGDTSNLESITLPAGVHDTSEGYRLEAVHTGTTYGDSTKGVVTYTTASSFVLVYGLNWDETNDTYLRTGDAASWTLPADFTNNNTVQAKMKRCVLNTDGTVNYFLFPTDSTLKEDGVTPSVLDGTDGNVMVQIPKFYYKYNYNTTTGVVHEHTISLAPIDGGTVHPAFVQNGVEKDYRYYPAYQGSVVGGKLMSISGNYVDTNFTRATYRSYAAANGTGWHVTDWLLYEALVLLMITEYGTMNLQAALGEGRVRLSGGTWADGSYFGIHGNSNSDGNFSNNNTYVGNANDAAADLSYMTYRGCENVWGNVYLFLDGININDRVVYLNDNPATFADDTTTNYTDIGVTMGSVGGYGVKLANSGKGFFPTDVTGGTDSTGTTDYYYPSTGWRVASVGGYANHGLSAGPLFLEAYYDSAYLNVHLGAGVSF